MKQLLVACGLAVVATLFQGCGGGSAGTGGAPTGGSATIDAAGGTLVSAEGVKVSVPAGAAGAPVTLRVAKDATGAPALPATGPKAAGDIYAITPHGQTFSGDVTVSVPVPNVPVADNEQLVLAKAELGGSDWVLMPTTVQDGMLQTTLRSFSFVLPVIVPFAQPLDALPSLAVDQVTALCNDMPCSSYAAAMSAGTLTDPPSRLSFSFRSNGGQLPPNCMSPTLKLTVASNLMIPLAYRVMPLWTDYREFGTDSGVKTATVSIPYPTNQIVRTLMLVCSGKDYALLLGDGNAFPWPASAPAISNGTVAIAAWPGVLTAVSGQTTSLPATLLMQGVPYRTSWTGNSTDSSGFPNSDLQTLVTWERSDDHGTSWRQVANTQQIDSTTYTMPFQVGTNWLAVGYWQAAHGFTATAADNGSLWRLTACWHDATLTTPDPCVTSKALTLTVIDSGAPPAYAQQPRDLLVTTGQTASFSAVADASNPLPVTGWQWQTRPANSNGAWTDVPGATTATYTTAVLGTADNGAQFRVLATNAAGSTGSDTVTVSVSDTAVAPGVTAQPLALSVLTGSDAVFAVAARGTEALSYQWLKNGSPIDSRGNASAVSPMLRLPATALADAADYSVQVSNAVGSVISQTAHLSVSNAVPPVVAPSIVSPPADAAVHVGDSASFGVGVGGTGPFTYQWHVGSTAIPGATQAVFTLPAVATGDAGSYHVTVSNSAGSVDSPAATLTVSDLGAPPSAPAITTDPATVTALPQTAAVFAVAASGSGPLSYQWSFNGTPLVDGAGVSGASTSVLAVNGVTTAQSGAYRVQVSNAAGAALSAAAQLIVVGAPSIATQPGDVSVTEGNTATFSVNAAGSFLNYQWLLNGEPITGATGPSYTTAAMTQADSGGTYRVLVYNNAGVVFSRSASVTVTPAVPVNWLPHGPTADWQALAVSRDGARLAVAGVGTQIQVSADHGATWTAAGPVAEWLSLAASGDGQRLVAGQSQAAGGQLYASNDGGASWRALTIPGQPPRDWMGVALSADGSRILAVTPSIGLFASTDGGSTWSRTLNTSYWTSAGMSADGSLMAATANNGQIYTSSDGGLNWLPRDSARQWSSVALSADGSHLVAAEVGGQVYTSTDRGTSWTPQLPVANWRSVALSADGNVLLAASPGYGIYVSRNGGATWVLQGQPTLLWTASGMSADGALLAAAVSLGQVYTAP